MTRESLKANLDLGSIVNGTYYRNVSKNLGDLILLLIVGYMSSNLIRYAINGSIYIVYKLTRNRSSKFTVS